MKLRYLGTAAAEGIPAIFCGCEICQKSRIKAGRNIRTRSQAIINDELLIDFPADTYLHSLYSGVDFYKIKHCLITHSHSDHLYERENFNFLPGMSIASKGTFHYYGGDAAMSCIENYHFEKLNELGLVQTHRLRIQQATRILNYDVVPLSADHSPNTSPVIFYISDGEKSMLYAHDTGCFPKDTLAYLQTLNRSLDFLSLDCTGGLLPLLDYNRGHFSFKAGLVFLDELREKGIIDSKTVICVNHFSHNGQATYDEMVEEADKYGILVSYDGMIVEF